MALLKQQTEVQVEEPMGRSGRGDLDRAPQETLGTAQPSPCGPPICACHPRGRAIVPVRRETVAQPQPQPQPRPAN
ncbi:MULTISPECIES: hypothetical protein [Streptomyces]|uniref:Uncharacterized protein n=1 Tax=Streptomyces cyaneofuscatus TaxID=66883 RepID=A0ABZ1F5U6_9ACTN|nr:hypothetical protein [Streptomyces cyaneofuscatus]WSB11610.1 hypothetical protein OG849_32285 [Streptomyces cyaneofuscatus]WSD44856.1 hypothetical protein OG857_03115 [Streptomyces cyaneofuscatus]